MTRFFGWIICGTALIFAFSNPAISEESVLPKWLLKTSIGGDFRYRHEMIDQDSAPEIRYRHRIRYRIWVKNGVNEKTTVTLRLASGGGTPNSLEQDLTGGASGKPITLNQAFAEYKPVTQLAILAGKFQTPYFSTPIVWDTDVNLEGLAVRYAGTSKISIFANLGGYWMQEYAASADQGLVGAQGGLQGKSEKVTIKAAAAYYDYINVEHLPTLFNQTNSFGNLVVPGGPLTYENDFDLVDAVASAKFFIGEISAITITGNVVNNIAADSANMGFLAGIDFDTKAGDVPLQFHYDYRDVEADATIGAFTDSSPGGGRTDLNGHMVAATAGVAESVDLNIIAMFNELNPDGVAEKYTRIELQALFKF